MFCCSLSGNSLLVSLSAFIRAARVQQHATNFLLCLLFVWSSDTIRWRILLHRWLFKLTTPLKVRLKSRIQRWALTSIYENILKIKSLILILLPSHQKIKITVNLWNRNNKDSKVRNKSTFERVWADMWYSSNNNLSRDSVKRQNECVLLRFVS